MNRDGELLAGEVLVKELSEEIERNMSSRRGYPHEYLLLVGAKTIILQFRDALKSIAQCQGDVPSIQAHDILRKWGYCDHSKAIYKAQFSGRANAYTCPDCGKASPERLVPFE